MNATFANDKETGSTMSTVSMLCRAAAFNMANAVRRTRNDAAQKVYAFVAQTVHIVTEQSESRQSVHS